MKPATVRYYFDADILGLGKVVAGLRPDATYPGDPGDVIHKSQRPPCAVASTDVDDVDWIPYVPLVAPSHPRPLRGQEPLHSLRRSVAESHERETLRFDPVAYCA